MVLRNSLLREMEPRWGLGENTHLKQGMVLAPI